MWPLSPTTIMLDFDLNLLTHLAVLLETRSVTQAARRMRTSQPAMSRSLAELRRLTGDPLLVRTRGGMLLTRRAEELAGPLRSWLDAGERLVAPPRLDLASLVRRFRITASDFGLLSVIQPALPRIIAEAPGVAIDLKPPLGDINADLASGAVDLAVTGFEPDRSLVHERRLFRDTFVCVTRTGHPLAAGRQGEAPSFAELLAWPHVSVTVNGEDIDPLSRAFRARGLGRNIIATTPYFAGAWDLLTGTDAVATLPARAARAFASGRTLTSFPAPPELGGFDYWITWHNRGHGDPALRWLIDLLARCCDMTVEDRVLEPAE